MPFSTKEVAKEKPKAPPSTRSKIGAPVFHNNQRVTLCMKFNADEWKQGSDCHHHHGCSIRLGNGRPCMQNHAAKDRKGSTWLSTTSSTPINPVSEDDPCAIIQSNSLISDEVIRPHQSETLNLQTIPIPNPTTSLPDNLQTQPSNSVVQKDTSHQPLLYINAFSLIFLQDTQLLLQWQLK